MNLAAINRDPALQRTPLGRVTLHDHGDCIAVFVDDGIRAPRWIDTIPRNGTVWDALSGKDFWSQRHIHAMRVKQRDAARARAEAELELMRRDTERGLARILAREGGTDQLIDWLRRRRAAQ